MLADFIVTYNDFIVASCVFFGICLVIIGFSMKIYSPKCKDERKMLALINASDYVKGVGILFVSIGGLSRIYYTNPDLFESIFKVL